MIIHLTGTLLAVRWHERGGGREEVTAEAWICGDLGQAHARRKTLIELNKIGYAFAEWIECTIEELPDDTAS